MTPGDGQVVWDTTGPRHLGASGDQDILVTRTGIIVPRVVADPSDPTGEDLLRVPVSSLSEIAAAEGFYRREYADNPNGDDFRRAENLAALRRHPALRVIDMDENELEDSAVFTSDEFAEQRGFFSPLGRGEAAALAIAFNREWRAGLDEKAARSVARDLEVEVVTTRQWLLEQVDARTSSMTDAKRIYARIRANGFWGPVNLTDP